MNGGLPNPTRRGLFASAAAALAGAAATALPRSVSGNDHDPIKAGEINTAQSTTVLNGTLNGRLMSVTNSDGGENAIAVAAQTNASPTLPGGSHAVFARNGRASGRGLTAEVTGVAATALVANATAANSTGADVSGSAGIEVRTNTLVAFNPIPGLGVRSRGSLVGVFGEVPEGEQDGPGIWGNQAQGVSVGDAGGAHAGVLGTGSAVGVAGISGTSLGHLKGETGPVGVYAETGVGGTALVARSESVALWAKGRVAFSTVYNGAFKAGQKAVNVPGLDIGMSTGIVATLNQSAGPGVYLAFARLDPVRGRATLVLNQKASRAARYTLFLVDQA